MEFSHGGFNQDEAKKYGSKWELSKMDRALYNQDVTKKCGSKWELGKMDRALTRMWQKSVNLNGNLAKWIGL